MRTPLSNAPCYPPATYNKAGAIFIFAFVVFLLVLLATR